MQIEDKMMSAREVARIFGMSEKTIRTHVQGVRVGRGYRYSRSHVLRAMGGQGCGPAPIPTSETPDHRGLAWEAQRGWVVNERRALCDGKTDMLVSTVAGFLIEHPDGDAMGDAFVLYARRHPPPGGGAIGKALRADIIREIGLRGLWAYS